MSFLRLQYLHRKIATIAANNFGETEADYFRWDSADPFDGPYGGSVYYSFDREGGDLGPNWAQTYRGFGMGAMRSDGAQAEWGQTFHQIAPPQIQGWAAADLTTKGQEQ